jgi:integrase/recombinase XerD
MPQKLTTTINKISQVPNSVNSLIIQEFHSYMQSGDSSERNQNNNLKAIIAFGNFIGPDTSFYDIRSREQILRYLDTKIKNSHEDPEEKWITTWNDYLNRIKLFFRWLTNRHTVNRSDWKTPDFVQIKEKKSKRSSPYSENDIWDRDELLTIIKYEPEIRNKAILALLWDLDARNHEITNLKIGNIRLRERYAEGEIPHNTKTGGGPILLTTSFPYVRDWLNKHPFKNSAESRLICSLRNGAPIKPDALCTMLKQLRNRIDRMVEKGSVTEQSEREKLEYLLRTKKWNPYCLRHSAITDDSDYLPEFAVKKKARWSMNSRQGSRYIKSRMGADLKRTILFRNGIAVEDDETLRPKPSVRDCPRCNLINTVENKYCSKCSYPLIPQAYEEIKANEDLKLKVMEEKHKQDMDAMREEMNEQFKKIMLMVQKNPMLAQVKPDALVGKELS